jgi:hypothetical protein
MKGNQLLPFWQDRLDEARKYRPGNQNCMSMPHDPDPVLRLLSDHMIREGTGDYLLSGKFRRFCRKHNLSEIWGGLLGSSGDRPELYGNDMVRNALFQLMQHIYRGRKADLPKILAGLLVDYGKNPSCSSFVPAIQQDLIDLGYSREDVEDAFSLPGI